MPRLLPKALLSSCVFCFCLAGVVSGGDPPPVRGPVSVFVQPGADEDVPSDSEKKERKENEKAARKALKELEKSLKKQHGKDRSKWPQDARTTYDEAADAYGMARYAHTYEAPSPKDKADSAADLKKRLGKPREDALRGLRELDTRHLRRVGEINWEFQERARPGDRESVQLQRRSRRLTPHRA